MKWYSRCWFVVTVTIGAVGLYEVQLAVPVWVSASVMAFVGVVSWICCLTWQSYQSTAASLKHDAGAIAAAIGGLTVLAVLGLSVFLGSSAVLVGLCLVGASPPVLSRLTMKAQRTLAAMTRVQPGIETGADRRRLAEQAGPLGPGTTTATPTAARTPSTAPIFTATGRDVGESTAVPSQTFPPVYLPSAALLRTVTDAELCSAWRISFLTLQRHQSSSDIEAQDRLIELRQHYLDELERRNPAGFRRWLYTGARPASDPSRYLATPRASR